MAYVPTGLAHCNYPIETDIQKKFWGSRHKCNRAQAIISFSLDYNNAMRNLKRIGKYRHFWRHRAWNAFGGMVNTPDMSASTFAEMSDLYWDCMPNNVDSKPTGPTIVLNGPSSGNEGEDVPCSVSVEGTVEWIKWTINDVAQPSYDDNQNPTFPASLFTPHGDYKICVEVKVIEFVDSSIDCYTYTSLAVTSIVHDIDIKFAEELSTIHSTEVNIKNYNSFNFLVEDIPLTTVNAPDVDINYTLEGSLVKGTNYKTQLEVVVDGSPVVYGTPNQLVIGSKPVITIDVESVTVRTGQDAIFNFETSLQQAPITETYTWYQSSDSGATWPVVLPTTSKTHVVLGSTSHTPPMMYKCVVSNQLGETETFAGVLTVDDLAVEPIITKQPSPLSFTEGDIVNTSVEVDPTTWSAPDDTVQWYFRGLFNIWIPVPASLGGDTLTLNTESASLLWDGYELVARLYNTGAGTRTDSDVVTIEVVSA